MWKALFGGGKATTFDETIFENKVDKTELTQRRDALIAMIENPKTAEHDLGPASAELSLVLTELKRLEAVDASLRKMESDLRTQRMLVRNARAARVVANDIREVQREMGVEKSKMSDFSELIANAESHAIEMINSLSAAQTDPTKLEVKGPTDTQADDILRKALQRRADALALQFPEVPTVTARVAVPPLRRGPLYRPAAITHKEDARLPCVDDGSDGE